VSIEPLKIFEWNLQDILCKYSLIKCESLAKFRSAVADTQKFSSDYFFISAPCTWAHQWAWQTLKLRWGWAQSSSSSSISSGHVYELDDQWLLPSWSVTGLRWLTLDELITRDTWLHYTAYFSPSVWAVTLPGGPRSVLATPVCSSVCLSVQIHPSFSRAVSGFA